MQFDAPLVEGVLLKRYKRFLADVELAGGELITAHTANTGAMTGCANPGSRVWLSLSENPSRKYAHTWELVEVNGNTLVGINTQRSNVLAEEAVVNGVVTELQGYSRIRREVRYPDSRSRSDIWLEGEGECYVEVKNVTLVGETGVGLFPDAKSERAIKHLGELSRMVQAGRRAVLLYCVQREDVVEVRAASEIHPAYADALKLAQRQGVELLAYRATMSLDEISLTHSLPVVLP